MTQWINNIALNRRRIALAYLDFCQRHFGGKWSDVVISKRKVVRVDLTQECVEALMQEFICTGTPESWGRGKASILEQLGMREKE